MKIAITNLQKAHPIKKSRVREIVREVLRQEDKDAELSIAFVDEDEIRRLNKRFLGKDSPTDVISFPLETKRRWVEGEVVVCVPVALKEATKMLMDAEDEIMLYVVHGILHLLGYNDIRKKDAKIMHQREKEILERLGFKVKGL